MSESRISVIMPCYNLGAFLDEAVESALAQDHHNLEIIIVNDGSTDPATNRLLADYRRPHTRVLHSENGGPARARNVAIEHATGDYLCALDADDKLAPGYFTKAAAILDADPSITFVSSWLQMFGDEDTLWKQDRCDLPTLLAECTVCTAALVRRPAVVSVGGFDAALPANGYEDWDLWLSLVERGFRGVILPEVMFYYRRRAGSVSTVACEGETHLTLWRALIAKHRESYGRHLFEVLHRKEGEISEWLQSARHLEGLVDDHLANLFELRQKELDRLQKKLDLHVRSSAPDTRIGDLEAALDQARRDIDLIRQSTSWRVTAPIRFTRNVIRRVQGLLGSKDTT